MTANVGNRCTSGCRSVFILTTFGNNSPRVIIGRKCYGMILCISNKISGQSNIAIYSNGTRILRIAVTPMVEVITAIC